MNRLLVSLSERKALLLDLLWAVRWLLLNSFGLATWRDAKSFRHRHRTGLESEHMQDRVVDDLIAVKRWKWFASRLVRAVIKDQEQIQIRQNEGSDVSFVIPFGDATGDRTPLLKKSLQRVRSLFPNAEIIVSCLSTNGEASRQSLQPFDGIVIVPTETTSSDFNIAQAVNKGVRAATRDVLCIMQADIYPTSAIARAYEQFIASGKAFQFPALAVIFMDEPSTKEFLATGIFQPRASSYCRELESYLLLVRREAFEEVGGYFEAFTESGEDNDFYDRLAFLEPVPQRSVAIFHMWHPLYWKQKPKTASKNRMLLHDLRELTLHERIGRARDAYVGQAAPGVG